MTNLTKKPETIAELKKLAFRIPDYGIIDVYPQWNEESIVFPIKNNMKAFSQNNGTIAFIDEEGTNYVIPAVNSFRDILKKAGYILDNFFVPFSNWDYPKYYEGTWKNLIKLCDKFNWEETREQAKEIAKSRNVQPLPKEILSKAKEIPASGIRVKLLHFDETIIYPNITSHFIDTDCTKLIGTYYYNNGTFVIQSDEGKTYTVKHFDGILDMLKEAGYVEKAQFVPFSNGEVAIS